MVTSLKVVGELWAAIAGCCCLQRVLPQRWFTTPTAAEDKGMSYIARQAGRYEDMSPTGKLELIQQIDGDIIVVVTSGEDDEFRQAAVEFCMPMTGGGQGERTHKALVALLEAMQADNEERLQVRGQ